MAMDGTTNPGKALAGAVDVEIAKFREMQEQLHSLRGDLQVVMGQQTENEMVQTELNLMDTGSNAGNVYKRVGPVLVRQDLTDAKETVGKRLQFIQQKQDGIKSRMADLERKYLEKGTQIQQMQADMQRLTAQAVNAIQQEHQASQG